MLVQALVSRRQATIVLTGTDADRALVSAVTAALPSTHIVDAVGAADLMTVAALISRCDLMITGDTGPMNWPADPRRRDERCRRRQYCREVVYR